MEKDTVFSKPRTVSDCFKKEKRKIKDFENVSGGEETTKIEMEVVRSHRELAGGYVGGGEALVPLYFFFIVLLFGAITLFLQQKFLRWFPYTIMVFLEGITWGVIVHNHDLGEIGDSFKIWASIDPFLLMVIFLPALLFGDGMRLNTYELISQIWQVMIMAVPGVLINTVFIAIIAALILPYGWNWIGCFLFGAILGAPDPVSVMPLLETSRAPKSFALFLSSESHLADLTTFTLFKIFLTILTEGTEKFTSPGKFFGFFAANLLGGPALGFFFGFLAYLFIFYTVLPQRHTDSFCEIAVTVVVAYLSFLVSEHNLAGNGILATVCASWVISHFAMTSLSDPKTMVHVWSTIEYMANTLIFFLSGVILGVNLNTSRNDLQGFAVDGELFGYSILIWAALIVVRMFIITIFFPLLKKLSPTKFTWVEAINLSWCGLKGALTLTLAYVVFNLKDKVNDDEDIQKYLGEFFVDLDRTNSSEILQVGTESIEVNLLRFYSLIALVTVWTLLINYLTAPFIMKITGLTKDTESEKQLVEYFEKRVVRSVGSALDKFKGENNEEFLPAYSGFNPDTLKPLVSSYNTYISSEYEKHRSAEAPVDLFNPDEVEKPADKEALANVRRLFLNAVKAQYWRQVENGILPKGSTAVKRLLYANAVALENADSYDMDDFTALGLPSSVDKIGTSWKKKLLLALDKLLSRKLLMSYEMDELEKNVYTASCYIEAHGLAEIKIAEYVGEDSSIDTPEEAYVIKESRKLVKQAKEFIALATEFNNSVVETVKTRKIAASLLRSQEEYVISLEEEGLIDENFLHHQITHLRNELRKVGKYEGPKKEIIEDRPVSHYTNADLDEVENTL